jgi:hypothetical protein
VSQNLILESAKAVAAAATATVCDATTAASGVESPVARQEMITAAKAQAAAAAKVPLVLINKYIHFPNTLKI